MKIPAAVRESTTARIEAHARRKYAGRYIRLDIRFRGPCCYISAFCEPTDVPRDWPPPSWNMSRAEYLQELRDTPVNLCRLRYFGDEEAWSLAFYTYSDSKYAPCVFPSGQFFGTPEEAFDVGAVYLK